MISLTAAAPAEPGRPRLRPGVFAVSVPGGCLVEGGARSIRLGGRIAELLIPAVLPLLDGTRTAAELAECCGVQDSVLYAILGMLSDESMLSSHETEGGHYAPGTFGTFLQWALPDRFAYAVSRRIHHARIEIICSAEAERWACQCVRLLETSGAASVQVHHHYTGPPQWRSRREADLIIAALPREKLGGLEKTIGSAEPATLLPVLFDTAAVITGPMIGAAGTPCWSCAAGTRTRSEPVVTRCGSPGVDAVAGLVAAGVVVGSALRIVGRFGVPAVWGHMVEVRHDSPVPRRLSMRGGTCSACDNRIDDLLSPFGFDEPVRAVRAAPIRRMTERRLRWGAAFSGSHDGLTPGEDAGVFAMLGNALGLANHHSSSPCPDLASLNVYLLDRRPGAEAGTRSYSIDLDRREFVVLPRSAEPAPGALEDDSSRFALVLSRRVQHEDQGTGMSQGLWAAQSAGFFVARLQAHARVMGCEIKASVEWPALAVAAWAAGMADYWESPLAVVDLRPGVEVDSRSQADMLRRLRAQERMMRSGYAFGAGAVDSELVRTAAFRACQEAADVWRADQSSSAPYPDVLALGAAATGTVSRFAEYLADRRMNPAAAVLLRGPTAKSAAGAIPAMASAATAAGLLLRAMRDEGLTGGFITRPPAALLGTGRLPATHGPVLVACLIGPGGTRGETEGQDCLTW